MYPTTQPSLIDLVERIRQRDATARKEFLECVHERLRRLAGRMFYGDFKKLDGRHRLTSILHTAILQLMDALEKTEPRTAVAVFRLAAQHLRWVLLNLVKKDGRHAHCLGENGAGIPPLDELADAGDDPQRLAIWAEFHDGVQHLPKEEQAVFELHYYVGLTQVEIAVQLGLSPRQVSRLWVAAKQRLADRLPE